MSDAVGYLQHLIASRGGRVVGRNEIATWAAEFELAILSSKMLDDLDSAYGMACGTPGLSG